MFKKLFNYMFPWAKQLVFHVHWAVSNLRAENVSHSFLNLTVQPIAQNQLMR